MEIEEFKVVKIQPTMIDIDCVPDSWEDIPIGVCFIPIETPLLIIDPQKLKRFNQYHYNTEETNEEN